MKGQNGSTGVGRFVSVASGWGLYLEGGAGVDVDLGLAPAVTLVTAQTPDGGLTC